MTNADYSYPSDAEFEAAWIETHRRHRVEVGSGNWLLCRTCSVPLKLTTRNAFDAVREIGTGSTT